MFGCNKEQVREAGSIAEELALNWREIIAGSEGFLTTEGRRGVFKRQIEWGEQDSMVGFRSSFRWLDFNAKDQT